MGLGSNARCTFRNQQQERRPGEAGGRPDAGAGAPTAPVLTGAGVSVRPREGERSRRCLDFGLQASRTVRK